MLDVADVLTRQRVRYVVIGAMAAAVHGVVRASLDADAIVALKVREAHGLRQTFVDAGYEADLRIGDREDPIPAFLEVRDSHLNRVDLLVGLHGLDPADARSVLTFDRASIDVELLRRVALGFGHDTLKTVDALLAADSSNDR